MSQYLSSLSLLCSSIQFKKMYINQINPTDLGQIISLISFNHSRTTEQIYSPFFPQSDKVSDFAMMFASNHSSMYTFCSL